MAEPRDRAWRRFKSRVKAGDDEPPAAAIKREKNWKLMYIRAEKSARAKQWGASTHNAMPGAWSR